MKKHKFHLEPIRRRQGADLCDYYEDDFCLQSEGADIHELSDYEYLNYLKDISDPYEFIREFVSHNYMFVGDYYYRDFHETFFDIAERILAEQR